MFYPVHSIHSYVHGARIGVLVEFGLQTDFAERTDEFSRFARDIALHITAMAPTDVADLLSQPSLKNNERTVGELLTQLADELREPLAIIRFVRWTDASAPGGDGASPPDPPGPPAAAARLRVVR
ncbi:hypothetical protein [Lysobacter sp. CA199]|uniref:hypothetical protein n=1 Tax=Lysobacter sp. CA199 TaxID=3455608 RepID=UPI003F8D1974